MLGTATLLLNTFVLIRLAEELLTTPSSYQDYHCCSYIISALNNRQGFRIKTSCLDGIIYIGLISSILPC
jgi:hypothetical protein